MQYWDPGSKCHRNKFVLILKNWYINYHQIETPAFVSFKEVYILDISTIINVFVFSMSRYEREKKGRGYVMNFLYLKLGHNCFLQHPLQFITHYPVNWPCKSSELLTASINERTSNKQTKVISTYKEIKKTASIMPYKYTHLCTE
jgi:hypothetical protein